MVKPSGKAGKTPSPAETLEYLYSLQTSGIKPGLERIAALLSSLKNPQNNFPSIHIAGTNGKGSTAAMTGAALESAGYRTGLYTSPHLTRFNERIRINGRPISDAMIVKTAGMVRKTLTRLAGELARPSFFEFTTAMAFLCFKEKQVDVAVIETGMGGRWDATNTVTPLVSIITNITKEHTQYLGSTLGRIAAEKAGIIKPGVPVITAEEKPAALKAIKSVARKNRSPLYVMGTDFCAAPKEKGGITYKGMEMRLTNVSLSLKGPFQARNAACSLAAIEVLRRKGFNVPVKAVRSGFRNTCWPGRVEVLSTKPLVILDSAHNGAGAKALGGALEGFRFKRLIIVAGVMADKDISAIFSPLLPLADTFILTRPRIERAAAPPLLEKGMKRFAGRVIAIDDVGRACSAALEEAGPQDAVCVTGSIFTVGEAREYLLKRLKKGRLK